MQPQREHAFERLGAFIVRRSRLVLISFVLATIVLGVIGLGLFKTMQSGGYDDPSSESGQVATTLANDFHVDSPVAIVAATDPAGIDAHPNEAKALVSDLSQIPGVTSTISYWTSGQEPGLKGQDGLTGEIILYAKDATQAQQKTIAKTLLDEYAGNRNGFSIYVGGYSVVSQGMNQAVTEDLARAESIAIPLTIVLLIIIFGSLVSAGLPLLVAAGSIAGSMATVFAVSHFADVSIFALNLITGLGLGLGIDYALLVVNRFREEVSGGSTPADAVIATVASAGRTVFISGITVALTLASLLVFPQYFLRSFAYAGISVTLFAILATITALPAALALLGTRVDRLRVRKGSLAPKDTGLWATLARLVMHRPWPFLVGAILALVIMAMPIWTVSFGQVDARALPADNPVAVANEVFHAQFPSDAGTSIEVLLNSTDAPAIAEYANGLTALPNVTRVITPVSVLSAGKVVGPNPAPQNFVAGQRSRIVVFAPADSVTSPAASALVDSIRAAPAPGGTAMVGGGAASFTDAQHAMTSRLPWVFGWIALSTLIILFLYTGSVVLPIKAVILNLATLAATIGVLVWVFQDGHLQWLVGDFTVTGSIDTSVTVLVAVVAFALSMDYEVFLISRIKEQHDHGMNTTDSVAFGLQRSGRIITAAALLIAIVFASFLTSGVTAIKQLGFGVAFAILLDATVVRGLLVPAFMRLAGRWNWWCPPGLRAVHERFGITES